LIRSLHPGRLVSRLFITHVSFKALLGVEAPLLVLRSNSISPSILRPSLNPQLRKSMESSLIFSPSSSFSQYARQRAGIRFVCGVVLGGCFFFLVGFLCGFCLFRGGSGGFFFFFFFFLFGFFVGGVGFFVCFGLCVVWVVFFCGGVVFLLLRFLFGFFFPSSVLSDLRRCFVPSFLPLQFSPATFLDI